MPLAETVQVGGHDLDVEGGHAELIGDQLRVAGLVAVGLRGQAEHHLPGRVHPQEDGSICLVSHESTSSLVVWLVEFALAGEALALLMGGQGVVLLEVAERRLGSAEGVGRDRGTVAARIDALLGAQLPPILHPGVVWPRFGP